MENEKHLAGLKEQEAEQEQAKEMCIRDRSRTGKSRGGVRMSAIVKVEDLTYIYNQGMPDETVALLSLIHISRTVLQKNSAGTVPALFWSESMRFVLIRYFCRP